MIRGVYEREKKSGIWWIRYTDVNGAKRREKVGRRSDAITLLSKRKTEKLQHAKLPETTGHSIAFGELLDDALEHSAAENGERSTHELKLKVARLRPDWGDRRVRNITRQDIVRWLQTEKSQRNWTPATTNRWQACFSLVFRVGLENQKIGINPASRIRRKTENNQRTRFLSMDEETRVRSVLASRYPAFLPTFLLSLHTGLRVSEQWRLTWSDIDFGRRILTVRKQKSRKAARHIPLNEIALTALRTLDEGGDPNSPVFTNSRGTAMRSSREWFNPALREAAVVDYTWHCNRHTFASRLSMAGVDLRTIAELMGHTTIQMTMRYAHLSPQHNQSAVDRLVSFGNDGTPNRTPTE